MSINDSYLIVFLFILIWNKSNVLEAGNCPEFWEPADSVGLGCLLFRGYSGKITWTEAKNYCENVQNATLIEIQTEDQLAFIETYLFIFEDILPYPNAWWTGGTDLKIEGLLTFELNG